MMIGRRWRELKQLYDSTEEISEPKITPVLEGVYRIQGPIDESDFELKEPKLVDSPSKKKQSSQSKNPKFEKGTCNVCYTPCSSCSHLKNQDQFCSESKPKPNQVKEVEICPSVRQVGDNNMSGCNLTHDPKVECDEGKLVVESGKDVKAESWSGLAELALVSNEVEEKMTPGTVLAEGVKSDKMTVKQEEEAIKLEPTDDKCENGIDPSMSEDDKEKMAEAENSDYADDDVKVCDICGDQGLDDSLAFCTRCSDGAEHIYCMRVMMNKLPEGEWLCEECQIEVQAEKQKEKQKIANEERREKKTETKFPEKKPPRRLNSYFQRKEENQEEPEKLEAADEMKTELKIVPKKKELQSESAQQRKIESLDPKKKESTITKKIDPSDTKKTEPVDTKKIESVDMKKKFSASSHENSVLDPDSEKGKLGTSLSRGPLLKSTSFKAPSSKVPKVKQITEVPQNPKISKEPISSNNLRREPDRIISKSGSFKNPNQSATTETLKKPPPKEPKEKNLMNNASNITNNSKGTSILGRPSIGVLSSSKIDSSGAAISQGQDNAISTGRNEIKRPNVPKPPGSLLPKPDDISTCSLLDSILQRSVPSAIPRAPRCQRCNETGHAIQFCPKDPTRLSALKPPSERNAKEGVLKRPKFMDQKEHENSTAWIDPSNSLKFDPARLCSLAPVVFDQLKSTTVPEVEFTWQGGFELVREGKPADFYDGLQAHFSSCVSPKVQEIVKQFPLQVQLEEVPRQKTWPLHFQVARPTEDNIALYFFARDRESYENCYIKLLESMCKNDLALRGKIDDNAELLVFPSNLLPEYSQRWNKLYYLWGVFRGRSARFSKKGPISTPASSPCMTVQDLNHSDVMEIDTITETPTTNCSKDKPDVKETDTEENKVEPVSVSPPFVDLNLCEDTEPELVKEKESDHSNENQVGTQREKSCEKPTDRAVSCDRPLTEGISCRVSGNAELSKNTSSLPEFLLSGPSNSPNLTKGDNTAINIRPDRKRSTSMEPLSSTDHAGIYSQKECKKAKIDSGDLHSLFSSTHVKPLEKIIDERVSMQKDRIPTQSSRNDDNLLYPDLSPQNRGNSKVGSGEETKAHQNLNLESPPRENSTPDLELALGDTKKSPKKGPILPFLSSNLQGDGSSSKQVQVVDESSSLSLSLGFSNAISDRTGEAGPNMSPGNKNLFLFYGFRDS